MKGSFLLIAACLMVGCSGLGERARSSPEQAVTRSIPRDAQQFELLARGVTPDREVAVVYSYRVPTPRDPWPEEYTLGYKVLQRENWIEWRATQTVLSSSPTLERVRYPIPYDVFQDGYTAVYGPLQSTSIGTVEAVFSNVEAVQQAVEGSGFLIFLDEKAHPCELRFFDSQGGLLGTKTLSKRHESHECP